MSREPVIVVNIFVHVYNLCLIIGYSSRRAIYFRKQWLSHKIAINVQRIYLFYNYWNIRLMKTEKKTQHFQVKEDYYL